MGFCTRFVSKLEQPSSRHVMLPNNAMIQMFCTEPLAAIAAKHDSALHCALFACPVWNISKFKDISSSALQLSVIVSDAAGNFLVVEESRAEMWRTVLRRILLLLLRA